MEHQKNLQVNSMRMILISSVLMLLLNGCMHTSTVDINMEVPENNWLYAKSVKATIEVKDPAKAYNISFKVRNTADYRYSNLYVIAHLKGNKLAKSIRYQFQLAKADGEWLGKGSGDLFSHTFPLLKRFRFPEKGKYELEVEQNMRNNPLVGISDVGITVEEVNND
jgi:gliding motility-associated lipoprotein GldH